MPDFLKYHRNAASMYFRIGMKYWHLFKYPLMDGSTRLELHRWNKAAIIDDHGREFLKEIRTFENGVDEVVENRSPRSFYFCDFVKVRTTKPGHKTPKSFYILKDDERFFRHVNTAQPADI